MEPGQSSHKEWNWVRAVMGDGTGSEQSWGMEPGQSRLRVNTSTTHHTLCEWTQ